MRSSAAADDEAVGTIASSPGCPVGGQRHVEAVDGLQADEHAFDLVEVAAQRQRIVDHGADRGVGVDEEDGSDGRRRTFARLDHAVEVATFIRRSAISGKRTSTCCIPR